MGNFMDINWGNSSAFESRVKFIFGDSYNKKLLSDANLTCELFVWKISVMFSFSGGLVNVSYSAAHCLRNFQPGNTSLNIFSFSIFAISILITL